MYKLFKEKNYAYKEDSIHWMGICPMDDKA